MVVDYTVQGDSFMPGKVRVWYDKPLFYAVGANLYLGPDGKRFVVVAQPEAAPGASSNVHITFLFNFLRRAQVENPVTLQPAE
jgi:hypothetical protein